MTKVKVKYFTSPNSEITKLTLHAIPSILGKSKEIKEIDKITKPVLLKW